LPTHAIKSRVGKLKTRVGKLKKIFGASRRIFSKSLCPPWPESVPAPLIYSKQMINMELECGPVPNMMAALPNIGGASVQHRKVWLTPTTKVPCINAAKMRNPLKFAGEPQTRQQISAVSRPKFAILSGHVEVLLFNKFFSGCPYMP